MNTDQPSPRPSPTRRWFLSLLATRPGRHLLHTALLATLALNLITPTWAGEDFQVNTYTTDLQHHPAVALDTAGNFVIVWESNGSNSGPAGADTDGSSIQARQFDANGLPTGDQFQVNSYTTGQQSHPAVALDSDGDFVIVWESNGASGDTSSSSIQGQRYNSAGFPQGSQFQVNSYTQDTQYYPAIAIDSDGDFVVVWSSNGSDGSDTSQFSVQAQRYDSAGIAQGTQFQINSYTTGDQKHPVVSLSSYGDFVVAWQSAGSSSGPAGADTDSNSIQAQRYSPAGTPRDSEFQINSYTTANQRYPAIALDQDGDFVVVWRSGGSAGSDTSGDSIQAQRYSKAGAPQGDQFQVNSFTTDRQRYPAVAIDSNGDFVVVWDSNFSDTGDPDTPSVQAQLYSSGGTPRSNQFQVNTHTPNNQVAPVIALDNDGDFVVAWASDGHPGLAGADTDYAIAARRFSLQPTDVSLTTLHPAAPTLPLKTTLLALLTALATLLTAAYLRLRRPPTT